MKYIITGKHTKDGSFTNDSGNLDEYTELGWELMVARLHAIKLLEDGVVTKNDTIITHPDRKCLYTEIFQSVKSDLPNTICDTVDIVSHMGDLIQQPHPLCHNKELITSICYDHALLQHQKRPFICIAARQRAWNRNNNVSLQYWAELIEFVNTKGYDTYVFGKGAEPLANGYNSYHVNLSGWCTALHHPLCQFAIGPMTGAMIVTQLCYSGKVLIIDQNNMCSGLSYKDHPLFYGDCVNFSGAKIDIIQYIPNMGQVLTCMTTQ